MTIDDVNNTMLCVAIQMMLFTKGTQTHHNIHHSITLDNTACKYIKLVYSTIFTLNVENHQSNTDTKE